VPARFHTSKKGKKGGEDCYFFSEKILVIADGVGGWNQLGVDPAEFSREMCKSIKDVFDKTNKIDMKTPKQLLVQAVKMIKAKGSSTCTIIIFDEKKRKIYASYIGDSCYLLVRCEEGKLKPIEKSREQVHKFNIPYQIGIEGDNPDTANTKIHNINPNDIIVVGSDGLWDNLEIDEIIRILNSNLDGNKLDTDKSAKELAKKAEMLSTDKDYLSPFSKKARENNIAYTGGKPDDITIIVAQVRFDKNSEEKFEKELKY